MNKLSTKVDVHFHILNSSAFNDDEKNLLISKLKNRINAEGFLHLSSQKTRSQFKNKEDVLAKLISLIENGLKVKKDRKKTKPSKVSKEKRLESKKIISEKKKLRNRIL